MIKFRELRINEDSTLSMSFKIEDNSYYDNIVITGFRIDTEDTYGTDTPYEEVTDIHKTAYDYDCFIPNAKSKLIFVSFYIEGTVPPDAPCGADIPDVGVLYDPKVFNPKAMAYLKSLGDTCNLPIGFIDFILMQKAFEYAVNNCNYSLALKYWKMLMGHSVVNNRKGCGCYG